MLGCNVQDEENEVVEVGTVGESGGRLRRGREREAG